MSNEPYETIEHRGFAIEIYTDFDADNPRTEENLGEMLYWHDRDVIGDRKIEHMGSRGAEEYANGGVYLPVYIFQHSCIRVRTTPFNCPWDSGHVGWIIATREKILKNYEVKKITKKIREEVRKRLISEVETYDNYLNNEVYGYSVEKDDYEDSCWGFYPNTGETGPPEYMIKRIKSDIDHYLEKRNQAKQDAAWNVEMAIIT